MIGGRGITAIAGTNPVIERQLAAREAHRKSITKSYRMLKYDYKGKITASRKPYSKFVLFEFEDDSSEFVIDLDLIDFCTPLGIKNIPKFLDFVQNYGRATIQVG